MVCRLQVRGENLLFLSPVYFLVVEDAAFLSFSKTRIFINVLYGNELSGCQKLKKLHGNLHYGFTPSHI